MKLFKSATIKLAGWYLLILMTVSLLFSVIIFQVAQSEIEHRVTRIFEQHDFGVENLLRLPNSAESPLDTATANLLASLIYINLTVLLAGGAGAYLLAKYTLKPIEQAHESQSRFVANASHQLRTPLAIIKAETELVLANKSAKKEDIRQTLISNLEEVNHLAKLSGMLLKLSHSEQTLKDNPVDINLAAVLRDIIKARKIKDRTTIDTLDSIHISTHETAIREIFNILIDNAIKHSPLKSNIQISITESRNHVYCKISNKGLGISKKQMPHIFERFYRSSESEGYGLGLPLAKQLIHSLGGSISVSSDSNLTTFELTLPKR